MSISRTEVAMAMPEWVAQIKDRKVLISVFALIIFINRGFARPKITTRDDFCINYRLQFYSNAFQVCKTAAIMRLSGVLPCLGMIVYCQCQNSNENTSVCAG